MTMRGKYPPRFQLVVSGKNATTATLAQITFIGSCDDIVANVFLEPDDGKYVCTKQSSFSLVLFSFQMVVAQDQIQRALG